MNVLYAIQVIHILKKTKETREREREYTNHADVEHIGF